MNGPNLLWGQRAKLIYLLLSAGVMLFTCLGGRDLWTQEHRWADIVAAMFYYQDFLHPSLNGQDYYDKPLLSYWLIALTAKLTGHLSLWALRLPSALAGLLAVWSIYQLGKNLKNSQLGFLAGWMLITTFYFVFWARTSSADMLNMAGTLFAVHWYFAKKTEINYKNYVVFFLILAITALCKGLIGPAVACLAILPDLIQSHDWKKHLRLSLLLSLIPALIIYALPFWASLHFSNSHYEENGLYLVYRENILRYFQPFDHKGPIYTYFIFLPLYLFPWIIFFIPALFSLKSRWKNLSAHSKWLWWAILLLFLFLTLSGSRRNYYVLPIVPFALLATADWILAGAHTFKRYIWAGWLTLSFFLLLFLMMDVLQTLYYAHGGVSHFADEVKQAIAPNTQWQYVMLDPESKVRFYLKLPPETKNDWTPGNRKNQTTESLLKAYPNLTNKNINTIIISRKEYAPLLKKLLPNYRVIEAKATWGERLLGINNLNAPVAYLPPAIEDAKLSS